MKRYERTVPLGVMILSPRSKLHDSLQINVEGLQLLSHLGFGHGLAKFFEQAHVSIPVERKI
jgi:hypothetical protein